MEIRFSRRARRRADLYKIPQSTIVAILENKAPRAGIHEIVEEVEGFTYPLKVVLAVEGNVATVITGYPLKKGRKP
jgi:hypothetical protein